MNGQEAMAPASGQAPQKKSYKGLITALIAVGVIALIGAGVGGYFIYKFFKGPADAARQFFMDIAAGQVEKAYNDTSSGFKDFGTLEDFTAFVEANPELSRTKKVSFSSSNIVNQNATLSGNLYDENDEPSPVEVDLVKVGDVWKVDGVELLAPGDGSGADVSDGEAALSEEEDSVTRTIGPMPEPPTQGQGIFVQVFPDANGDRFDIYDAAGNNRISSAEEANTLVSIAPGTYSLYRWGNKDFRYAAQVVVQAGKVAVVPMGAIELRLVSNDTTGDRFDIYDVAGTKRYSSAEAGNTLITVPPGTYTLYRWGNTDLRYASQVVVQEKNVTVVRMGAIQYTGTARFDIYDATGTTRYSSAEQNNAVVSVPPGDYLLKQWGSDKPLTGVVHVEAGQTTVVE